MSSSFLNVRFPCDFCLLRVVSVTFSVFFFFMHSPKAIPECANQEPISGNRFLAIIVVFHSKHPVRETNICNLDPYLFLYQLLISGHRPAQRECARTGLRSHARCHRPHPIPQPVKVGHTSGLRPLLFSNSDAGSFTSHKNKSVKVP